jgi:hypothetical protein
MQGLRPTEIGVAAAAAAVISGTQVPVIGSTIQLPSKVVPRWILALGVGEAISHLSLKDNNDNALPVNAWVLTTASWVPSKVKSQNGYTQTPKDYIDLIPLAIDGGTQQGGTGGDVIIGGGEGGGDVIPAPSPMFGFADDAASRGYKISVQGSLKVWQLVEYRQGSDVNNSERDSMNQRQAVIDSFTINPRIGLVWPDFEHDELKFNNLSIVPFDSSLIHVAQATLPFSFSYVVNAA